MSNVAERVSMCIAEAGYNPADVRLATWDDRGHTLEWCVWVPPRVVWRAGELAGMGSGPACFACWKEPTDGTSNCRAVQRMTEDCGIERAS